MWTSGGIAGASRSDFAAAGLRDGDAEWYAAFDHLLESGINAFGAMGRRQNTLKAVSRLLSGELNQVQSDRKSVV